MRILGIFPCGRMPKHVFSGRIAGAVFLLTVTPSVMAEDAYLEALDQEAAKVDVNSTANGSSATAAPTETGVNSALRGVSLEKFEAYLQREHTGTHSLYRKLPVRSREEVFGDFSNGASMAELQEKIFEKFLHP